MQCVYVLTLAYNRSILIYSTLNIAVITELAVKNSFFSSITLDRINNWAKTSVSIPV